MSDLWIVVPAAGKSRRFQEAGYSTYKPLLMIKNRIGETRTMMSHVLTPVMDYLYNPKTDERTPYKDVIVGLPSDSHPPCTGLQYYQIEKTAGQADTVYQMIQDLPQEDPILILDCDMVLQTEDISRLVDLIKVYDVAIAVTETFDPNASRVDQIPYPTRFVEKEPISNYGIVGARAFRNIGNLKSALRRTIERYKVLGQEPYLSVAINHYPGTKFAHLITQYEDWGTPERIKESGAEIVS